jgi:hypothetical protein
MYLAIINRVRRYRFRNTPLIGFYDCFQCQTGVFKRFGFKISDGRYSLRTLLPKDLSGQVSNSFFSLMDKKIW